MNRTEHRQQHESGYFCELFADVDTGDTEFRIAKHDSDGYNLLANMNYNWLANEYYYMIIRAEGTDIKAKVWHEDAEEPETWDLEVTDTEWDKGLVGIGNFNQQGDRYIDWIGMGWLGNRAPRQRIGL